MEQEIKIAVIGGTGKSGKYLVKLLLSKGFHLRLLIRNPESFQNQSSLIEVVKGDVKDYVTVRTLLDGCQAVISTLGLGQTPNETSIFSQATKNIIRSINESKVQRYIVITGLNVDTPLDKKSPKTKFATDWMYSNYPKSTTDKQSEYKILAESNINWTLVRLPMIEQTDTISKINVSMEDCQGDKISATSLAYFLIEQLFEDTYIKQAPFIANI
jgi:putative NADH-flavin reductase